VAARAGSGALGDPGLFPPGSVARRVNEETALILGGGRALLMQLAHPMVAAGVADHSRFREDPLGRLANTLDLTLTVSFGDEGQRRAAAARVAETHRSVTGSRDGGPYRALDPDLLLWVHATLVDSALVTYRRFVGPLAPNAAARYHQDMRRQAEVFGVPSSNLPSTLEDFERYVTETLRDLEVTREARDLAAAVLGPPVHPALRPIARAMAFVTIGLLPEPIRHAYGLHWDDRRERRLSLLAGAIRTVVVPVLPDRLRRWPHARDADRRLAGTGARLS
jgi:uncharacterized protein (DUF2236 family)